MNADETRRAAAEIFTRIGRLLANGVPFLKAIEAMIPEMSDRKPARIILEHLRYFMECGRPFSGCVEAVGIFPQELVAAIRDSEKAGRMDSALIQYGESIARGDFSIGEPVALAQRIQDGQGGDFKKRMSDLVDEILQEAYAARASDLHIDPGPETGTIRIRLDGVLQPLSRDLTGEEHQAVVSRIKAMTGMDVAEHALPQDGRLLASLKTQEGEPAKLDLRVSTCPFMLGERLVVRFLDRSALPDSLEAIRLPDDAIHRIRGWLRHTSGLVVVSGPKGSGKTTTLLLMLKELAAKGNLNLLSVEDPVEYLIPGVQQQQVRVAVGLDFPAALRSFSRQDPDVVAVGEVRDMETASMIAKIAHAGHLVLTQLHTRDAAATVKLLYDLGAPMSLFLREILIGVVSQRLVRRLCAHCRRQMGAQEKAGLPAPCREDARSYWNAVGCEACAGTGYRGRVPVVELLEPGPGFWKALADGCSAEELARELPSSHQNLRQAGIALAAEGLTTVDEIERVL